MKFDTFGQFLENRAAAEYDTKLAMFNNRFKDPKEGEEIVKMAGYASVQEFLNDPDPMKWNKLHIPGQQNYV